MKKTTPSSVKIINFGCRLNSLESQHIRQLATQANMSKTIVVNGCAVTNEAERQVKQSIRKLAQQHPDYAIVATGCGVQLDPQSYHQMPEVHATLGNVEKRDIKSYHHIRKTPKDSKNKPQLVGDIGKIKQGALHLMEGICENCRAFVEIQNGCNHRCTFCTIHIARGKSYSYPQDVILRQIEHLLENDIREIVLTGVDITSYGEDTNTNLGNLIKVILKNFPKLPRLRLSSLDCIEVDDTLLDLFSNEPRLMPHIHLSLQSGNDLILKRMLRRHARRDAVELINKLRHARSDIVIGSDMITGFPSETEEMFQNTLSMVQEHNITHLHVFPFSSRNLAPAAKMKRQVPRSIAKERATRLRLAGEKCLKNWMQQRLHTTTPVLIERVLENGIMIGKDPYFTSVNILPSKSQSTGDVVDAQITAVNNSGYLEACLA